MLRAQADQLADQVAHLPTRKWQFEIHTDRFLPRELRQIKWQISPLENVNFTFILIHSYSESSGRPPDQVPHLTPPGKWKFDNHTDRFLLWELRQTRWQIKWQIFIPQENGNFRFILIDFYPENSGRSSGRSTPVENGNLRIILIHSYSETSDRPGGILSGRSPPQNMAISDSYW